MPTERKDSVKTVKNNKLNKSGYMSEKLGELKSLYDDGQNAFYKNTFSDGWDAFESLNIPVKFLQCHCI